MYTFVDLSGVVVGYIVNSYYLDYIVEEDYLVVAVVENLIVWITLVEKVVHPYLIEKVEDSLTFPEVRSEYIEHCHHIFIHTPQPPAAYSGHLDQLLLELGEG